MIYEEMDALTKEQRRERFVANHPWFAEKIREGNPKWRQLELDEWHWKRTHGLSTRRKKGVRLRRV